MQWQDFGNASRVNWRIASSPPWSPLLARGHSRVIGYVLLPDRPALLAHAEERSSINPQSPQIRCAFGPLLPLSSFPKRAPLHEYPHS
jgi:hypothetical protein